MDLDVVIVNLIGRKLVTKGGRVLTDYKALTKQVPFPRYNVEDTVARWFITRSTNHRSDDHLMIRPRMRTKLSRMIDNCIINGVPWKDIKSIEEIMD